MRLPTLSTARLRMVALHSRRGAELENAGGGATSVGASPERAWATAAPPEFESEAYAWDMLLCDSATPPTSIGRVCLAPTGRGGELELWCSVLASHQRRGLASEACRAVIAWASRDARLDRIVARLPKGPELPTKGLERLGFSPGGAPGADGGIRFALELG